MSTPTLKEQVIAAIDRELRRQAEEDDGVGFYNGGDLPVLGGFPATYDGDLFLDELADAAILAVKTSLKQRLVHDEEGVIAMLEGERGPLETPPTS